VNRLTEGQPFPPLALPAVGGGTLLGYLAHIREEDETL
jgi:hypothetical protein